MKKGFKLGAASLAALMVFGAAGCGKDGVSDKEGKAWAEENGYVKEGFAEGLPESVRTDLATCDGAASSVAYSNQCAGISGNNLKDYLGRNDIVYIDVRDDGSAGDSATAFTEYSLGHLKGFKLVEFFDVIYNGGVKGTQLFYKTGAAADGTPIFAPRYADSVEMLESFFPKDKTLFIMCAKGGRVTTVLQLLAQYGWNMDHVYNVGGWDMYDNEAAYKDYRVTTNIVLTELPGTATGKAQGTTGDDISANVTVLLDAQNYIVKGAYLTGGTIASSHYLDAFKAEVDTIFDSLVGLTVEEVRAKVTNNALTDKENDVVAGATNSTLLIYKAVINALSTVVVE